MRAEEAEDEEVPSIHLGVPYDLLQGHIEKSRGQRVTLLQPRTYSEYVRHIAPNITLHLGPSTQTLKLSPTMKEDSGGLTIEFEDISWSAKNGKACAVTTIKKTGLAIHLTSQEIHSICTQEIIHTRLEKQNCDHQWQRS
ncbi:hypothetical protein HUJ05_000822 [Dendroctonus ponderosae]|nr:hypothetical protein HUJ05_000822 [Dendroctonus ponderosae]